MLPNGHTHYNNSAAFAAELLGTLSCTTYNLNGNVSGFPLSTLRMILNTQRSRRKVYNVEKVILTLSGKR